MYKMQENHLAEVDFLGILSDNMLEIPVTMSAMFRCLQKVVKRERSIFESQFDEYYVSDTSSSLPWGGGRGMMMMARAYPLFPNPRVVVDRQKA